MTPPLLHGFWNRPTPAKIGESDPNKIFLQVGIALTTWEGVEENFCGLLDVFSGIRSVALPRIYGAIVSSNARSEAMSAAAEVFFEKFGDKPSSDTYALLIKHYKDALTRRNEIAHGRVISFTSNDKRYGHFLIAPIYWTKKTKSLTTFSKQRMEKKNGIGGLDGINSEYRYVSSDIAIYTNKFRELNHWIADYYNVVASICPPQIAGH